jgi:hypothetical protein
MASLKSATKSALEDRSPRFMLGTIALGVVISLIVGFGIGYAAHTSSGSSNKAKKLTAAQKKKRNKAKANGKKKKIVAAPDLTGGIFAVGKSRITVLNADKKGVRITVGHKTRINVAKAGSPTSIVVGSKVLFRPSTKDPTKATQVIVLPAKALVGQPVTAVDAGNSMTLKSFKGPQKITTKGATVWITVTGSKKNLVRREIVTVKYYLVGAKKTPTATQVVVMPVPPKAG